MGGSAGGTGGGSRQGRPSTMDRPDFGGGRPDFGGAGRQGRPQLGGLGGLSGDGLPQLGGGQNWEEILSKMQGGMQGRFGGRRPQGNPWQGGNRQMRGMFTDQAANPITNPGSLAASQGASTDAGITAPGTVTGAPATPANANPHAPTNAGAAYNNAGPQGRTHAQQLVQALRNRGG